MKTQLSKRIIALLLTLVMVLSLAPMAFAADDAEDLTGKTVILHTNDTHGALLGFAQVAKVKADFEARGAEVILVDAGDYSQGTTYVSTNKGEAAVTMLNAAGYDFATLGNHEFDFGYAQLMSNLEKAEFQPIVADVILKETGKSILDGHAIKTVDGVKIGFFGMETPETFTKVNPGLIQEITFPQGKEMYACAQAEVDALKEEGADLIIGLVHLGVDNESEPNRSIDLYKNVTGIDFLIDGHSHTVMTQGPNGEPIQSTGTKASKTALMNVGMIQIDNATKTVEKNELIPLGDEAPVDETVAAVAREIMDKVDAEYGAVFARSEVELCGVANPGNRTMETNNGNLITDAMKWSVLRAGSLEVADENVVALTNGGGIRAAIKVGDVTMNDINTVLPFGNTVAVVYVTGAELLEALEASTYPTPGAVGGFPQVSGIKFNIDTTKPYVAGNQYPASTYYGPAGIVRVTIDAINGKPFDPEATYAVITNNFCAAGGDTYYVFKNASGQFDTSIPLDQAVMEYITEELNGVIPASRYDGPEGRITQEARDGAYTGKTVILHTNDTHGALLGFAQVAKQEALFEAQGAEVILADAGDYSQGTTYVSTNKGEAAVTMLNAAGYDVATLGNHEFDFGYAQLMSNMEKAEFRPIVADVLLKETGASIFDGHTVIEKNGVKIGFFGMETPETFTKVNPGLIQEITFPMGKEMYACAQAEVNALKEEGAELIIGLVHLGVDNESEPNRSIDLYKNVTGIDFLIDGHSHTVMTQGPDGEPIQSTGTKASKTALMNVGCIVIDNASKQIEENYLIPLGDEAPVDETVAAVAREIMDKVDAEYGAVFARSEVELCGVANPGNRTMETNNGNLITDAMKWSVLRAGSLEVADENVVALTNGGGIRAAIKVGDVTMNDINTVLPFGNTVAVVYVTGAELLEALEASTYPTPGAVGGFPQVSGIKFNIDTTKEFDAGELYPASTYHRPNSIRRVTIESINGQKFNPKATYAVITNNFCAAGGDTYYVFKNASGQFDTSIPLDQAVMEYITEELNGVIPASRYAGPEGRISQSFRFEDVKDPGKYYYAPVYWAYEHDPQITVGISDTLFAPMAACTRAEAMTFLWKAYGAEKPAVYRNPFTDVKFAGYYYDAVLWAVDKGITSGVTATTFGTKLTCSRAEVVTFLWAAAGRPVAESRENPFIDVKVNSYYYEAVLWALEQGITVGTSDNTFSPNDPCTRGQIVTFLYNASVKEEEPVEEKLCFPSTSNEDIAKYGNVYTNLDGADFFAMGYTWGDVVTVKFLDQELELPVVPTFSYVDSGTPGVFVNKNGETGEPAGRVFLAINMGNFAEFYGLAIKTTNADKSYFWTAVEGVEFPVELSIEMKEAGGYLTEMQIRDINRTNNREDYPELTDEEFANFRRIETTGMGDHLYRGSSPINPEIGRNGYADAALEKAGVTVVMNLANSEADAKAYAGFADTYYSKQNVIYLNLGVDFFAEEFKTGLAAGLRHFAENRGVYYVHCTEGKDRAGFVSALLECLMGASYEEVVADYLKTYTNYYTVVDGKQQALSEQTLTAIADSNIIKTLKRAFDVEDLQNADLAAEAEAYVKELGLNDAEIAALKANLGDASEVDNDKFEVVRDSSNSTRFGHIDINISVEEFLQLFALGDVVEVEVNGYRFEAPVVTNYDDVNTGEFLLRCASGKQVVTLAINYGQIGVRSGLLEPVEGGYAFKAELQWPMYATVTLKEAGAYADELAIRKLTRTNERSDYDDLSDAEFANFRSVTTSGMGENVLYRSSSPIDPELGRNRYADAAARAAGVKTFVNLADTEADALAFEGYTDSYYSTQTKIFLGLPVAFTSEEFKSGLAEGYRFMASNEGPYLLHCLEGKDRTGLSIGVLECLMGASLAEVQADYLKTYENYFEVQNNEHLALTAEQEKVLTGIITKNLGIIFDAELETADLAAEAEAYLTEIGLTEAEIAALKTNLSGKTAPTTGYTVSTTLPENGKRYAIVTLAADGKYYALDNVESDKQIKTATQVDVENMTIAELPETVLFDAVVDGDAIQFMVGANYLHLNASKIRVTNGTTNSYLTFTPVAGAANLYTVNAENDSVLTFDGTTFNASNKGNGTTAQVYLFTLG